MALRRIIELFKGLDERELASMIDATILDPRIKYKHLLEAVDVTAKYSFKCLMIPPNFTIKLYKQAEKMGVKLCTVVGFPSGFSGVNAKVSELKTVGEFVDEIDIVPDFSRIETGIEGLVEELGLLTETARSMGIKVVKVIVESPLLSDEELELIVNASSRVGADYVKTSTGVYSKGGDYYNVARLYRMASNYGLKVKASGGIKTGLDAILALAAGATRIGTSSAVRVIESYKELISGAWD
ncbi:MAG: deoxyribose-phosphate aldolase [Desulfurococcales archaeon]|nr:deoxyribose-phosphate aldolase [Desulfurococcales archaeon]